MPASSYVHATMTEVDMWDGNNTYPNVPVHTESRYRTPVVKTAAHALRRLIPGIYLPPTAMYATHGIDRNWIVAANNGGWGLGTYRGDHYSPGLTVPEYNPAAVAELRNKAVIKALNNLRGRKINLAQAYAERRQTASLVGNSVERIVGSIRNLKRGNLSGAAQSLGLSKNFFRPGKKGSITDMWLELQYGWKPLLSDVHGAVEELNRKDRADPGRYYITVRASQTEHLNTTYSRTPGTWMTGFSKTTHGVRVKLDYQEYCPEFETLDRIGIADPASLAWELLPWSFVADWFVPVGAYLGAVGAGNGFSYKGGYSTAHFVGNFEGVDCGSDGWRRSYYWPGLYHFPLSRGTSYRKVVHRLPYDTSPVPRFPGFKNPLSLVHMANAIALLSSTVKTR